MPSPKRLKMKDLEAATGVGREAIRFYIREGLLPEPQRPAKNVAWYDESFVEKIRFIKELQEKRYLPLQVIQRIVADDGEPSSEEVDALLDLDGKLFGPVEGVARAQGEPLAAAAGRLGLSLREVRAVVATGAVEVTSRDGEDWVEGMSLEILEIWARIRRAGFTTERGFPPEQISLYVDTVEFLAREELRLFARGLVGRVSGEPAARMAEVGIDQLNKIIALLRKKTLLRLISEGNVPEPSKKKSGSRTRPTR